MLPIWVTYICNMFLTKLDSILISNTAALEFGGSSRSIENTGFGGLQGIVD